VRRRRLELVVDPIACDAHGVCSELFPEWIAQDPWGYPLIEDGPLPDELLPLARRAARSCPRLALHLVEARSR
jgi:ferredoxin